MLSIIIPTLNEEKYLAKLLESIKKQDFQDYEIIVADAGSKDKTLEIAKKHGAKLTKGGSPAQGRNQGAKLAKGDLLLFLDAEAILTQGFIKKALLEFRQRELAIASCGLEPITENKVYKLCYDFLYNWPARFLENVFPYASNFILVKKEIHKRIRGFDQEIKLAEDHSYARQAAKLAKFGFLKSVKMNFSPRRFQHDGWLMVGMKYYFCNFYNIFFGDVKSDIFKYELKIRNKKKEKTKIEKVILFILKLPLYPIWSVFACLGWLMVFLICFTRPKK